MSHARTFVNYLREDPGTYLVVAALGSVVGLFEFAGIASLLPAVSLLLGEQTAHLPRAFTAFIENLGAHVVIAAYVGAVLFQAGIAFFSEAYFLHVMAKWRTKLSLEYVGNLLAADFAAYGRLNPGEAEVIITRNVGYAVRNRHRTAIFLTDMILAVFYALIALVVSPHTFLLFVLLGGIYGLLNRRLTGLRVRHSRIASDRYLAAAQIVSEHFHDVRGLMASNRKYLENLVRRELDVASASQRVNDQVNAGIRLSAQPIMLALIAVGIGFSKLVFGIANAQILMMLYVFYRAAPKLIALARGYGEIIQDSPVDITPEILRWRGLGREVSPPMPDENAEEGIELRDVSVFHGNVPVLRNVSMSVRPGSLVAFVGRSGSGKSTLLDLLCGFMRPQSGSVRVWGRDPALADYDTWLHPCVSILRPESALVTGTVASNIAYLEECPDEGRVLDLVHRVGLEGILGPEGIRTPVAARGANLSAGQRQRILLARALYKRPRLLILDEPTSNLDRKTEEDINLLVSSLKGTVTTVVVSHRGRILKEADCIYRLEDHMVFADRAAAASAWQENPT